MGTRADFYVGRGKDAEWLGSIAWDGYPDGVEDAILDAKTEDAFREAIEEHLSDRDDWTEPSKGWPWPWGDSGTTDYAYAFDGGMVHASRFGSVWFDPRHEPEEPEEGAVFPDMSAIKNVAMDRRSGLTFITVDPLGQAGA